VVAVDNKLVVDWDLTVQVAQALASNELTRPLILPMGSTDGWVGLAGIARTVLDAVRDELQKQANYNYP
jgi:hypothetical protein